MSAPSSLPAPALNDTPAGLRQRASALAGTDIIVAVGDYTGGAADDMFTLSSHGLITGDHVHVLWQSAMGAVTGGEGTRAFVKYLTSSTFQLCSDGAASTVIENSADGTVVLVKGRIPTSVVETAIIPYIIVAAGDYTGGSPNEDQFTAAQGLKGLYEADSLKLLYKSAAGALTGIAAGTTVYAKTVTVSEFQCAATAGGAVIENTADGTLVFLKTS